MPGWVSIHSHQWDVIINVVCVVLKVSLIFVLLASNYLDENINAVECVSYISHK